MIFPLFVVAVTLALFSFFYSPNPGKEKVKQVVRTEELRKRIFDTLDY